MVCETHYIRLVLSYHRIFKCVCWFIFIYAELSQGSDITGDQLRLICMGKGLLGPDIKTLSECGVPIFETHATPVNVSVRPISVKLDDSSGLKKKEGNTTTDHQASSRPPADACCVIL